MRTKEFVKQHFYLILGIMCIAVMGVLFAVNHFRPAQPAPREIITSAFMPAPPEAVPDYVVVHILGEVHSPGVFTLPAGARIVDAVEMAGGHTDNADLTRINLAAPLRDAMQIVVPALGGEDVDLDAMPPVTGDGLVNLNTATAAELQALPGIGPSRAQNIISYREAMGAFTRIEDIMQVWGIGNAIFENIKERITV